MKVIRNTITIADLNNFFLDGDLTINKEYQRERGLWPQNARSFFIDTILNGYPFPKLILRQSINLATKKSFREIIDGQQRFSAIADFLNDKFKLSAVSQNFQNLKFSDLDPEEQANFLAYEVSIDTAVGASHYEVIEIFRRINSYTLPLNMPEQRHASYQGEFKWFIKKIIDSYTPLLETSKILSERDIARMSDADLFTELCQVIMDGVFTRSSQKLDALYRENDEKFQKYEEVLEKLTSTLDFIKIELKDILQSGLLSSFNFYSLFSALIFNKWGIKNIDTEKIKNYETINKYTININFAKEQLFRLLSAAENKNENREFSDFILANTKTTHSINNRYIRLIYFIRALQNN